MLDDDKQESAVTYIENSEAEIKLAIIESDLISLMPQIRESGATYVKTRFLCQKITAQGGLARVTSKAEMAVIDDMVRQHAAAVPTP